MQNSIFEQAKSLFMQGMSHYQQQKFPEAVLHFQSCLALMPDRPSAMLNLSAALIRLGRYQEAEPLVGRILQLDPQSAMAWLNKGLIHQAAQAHEQALGCFETAWRLAPHSADIASSLGCALHRKGQSAQALEVFNQALSTTPNAELWNNKAQVLADLSRFDEAEQTYRQALLLAPAQGASWAGLGRLCHARGQLHQALDCHAKAVALEPANTTYRLEHGVQLVQLNRPRQAIADFRHVLECEPERAEAAFHLATACLQTGDQLTGWQYYEFRFACKQLENRRHTAIPIAESPQQLTGKTVLIWYEQGLGDTLQFCRYIDLLRQQGAQVVFEVQPALKRLLARHLDADIVCSGDMVRHVDYQYPLLSLPHFFHAPPIPDAPVLRAQTSLQAEWQTRIKTGSNGKMNIALACAGNPAHGNDQRRSMPLAAVEALLEVANLFLVQQTISLQDQEWLARHPQIHFLGPQLDDFETTAAILANVDHVLSVDTSLAHLAGAMQRPTTLLLPWAAEWRWQLETPSSPWYPSIRLCRQAAPGDWASLIQHLRQQWAAPACAMDSHGASGQKPDSISPDHLT